MAGLISRRFLRAASPQQDFVVLIQVSRNAFGANFINQSLYISTDRAISAFQVWGLSR